MIIILSKLRKIIKPLFKERFSSTLLLSKSKHEPGAGDSFLDPITATGVRFRCFATLKIEKKTWNLLMP